jgi:hypothetical protein
LLHTYDTSASTHDVRWDGERLRAVTHEMARTFDTCGSCGPQSGEPRGTWTVRVMPDRVIDEGHIWVMPELELLDDLVRAVLDGRNISSRASHAVERRLQDWARTLDQRDREQPFGMLSHADVSSYGNTSVLHFTSDNAELTLTASRIGRTLFADDVDLRVP